ncbi:MAG TPA: hypothetical protein VH044_11510 [Polyangiaceae bacterium]|nr:hypothetical protein [Polyangiaceae bacterium]
MTKKKKDKKAGAVGDLARKSLSKTVNKTIGLVLKVGDALEAVAAAAEPVAPAAPIESPSAALVAIEPPPVVPAPVVPAPVAAVATMEAVEPAQVACVPMNAPAAPAAPAPVPVVTVSPNFDDGVRAALAIETYCAQHNLRIVDMPPYATLIDALKNGMAQRGSSFTDAEARSILDAQMRGHFRALGGPRHD